MSLASQHRKVGVGMLSQACLKLRAGDKARAVVPDQRQSLADASGAILLLSQKP